VFFDKILFYTSIFQHYKSSNDKNKPLTKISSNSLSILNSGEGHDDENAAPIQIQEYACPFGDPDSSRSLLIQKS